MGLLGLLVVVAQDRWSLNTSGHKTGFTVTASPRTVYLVSSSSPRQADKDSSVKNTVELDTSIESDYEDRGLCVACGLGEEEDEDDEVWVECT